MRAKIQKLDGGEEQQQSDPVAPGNTLPKPSQSKPKIALAWQQRRNKTELNRNKVNKVHISMKHKEMDQNKAALSKSSSMMVNWLQKK